jgi:hypothetical protein
VLVLLLLLLLLVLLLLLLLSHPTALPCLTSSPGS